MTSSSIMYLFKIRDAEGNSVLMERLPAPNVLEELNHQMVMLGFLFLSVGIITGAVWANSAWGRYWGWDPKETWSLITWFIYATLLHARMMRGWRGSKIAYFSIFGWGCVIYLFWGELSAGITQLRQRMKCDARRRLKKDTRGPGYGSRVCPEADRGGFNGYKKNATMWHFFLDFTHQRCYFIGAICISTFFFTS